MIRNNRLKFKKSHVILISLLILLSTLNVSVSGINLIGWVSILALLLLSIFFSMAYIIKNKSFNSSISIIQIMLALFCLVYLFGILNGGFKFKGLIIYLQLITLIVFLSIMASMAWKHREINIISGFVEIFIFLNLMVFLTMRMPYPFKSFASNSNSFSAITFFLSYFPVLNYLTNENSVRKKFLFFMILVNMLLIIMGQSRTVWVAAIAALLVFWKWNFITKNKLRYYSFFIAIIIAIIGLIILLPLLKQHPNAIFWNRYILEKTGGNLFSGRERIWEQLILEIMKKPIIGYGASTTPGDLIGIKLSSHNLYIQTAIQVGLVGVCALLVLFFSIWSVMYKGRYNMFTRLSGAYFIGIIIHQSAEVCLTQNNLAIGLIMWLIIAIGISNSTIDEKSNKIILNTR